MPLRSDGPAPYAPPATLLAVVQSYRDRGLKTPFTAEVLQLAGVTEALSGRTLQALKGLDLVDDKGMPTPAFVGLKKASQEEFKKRLEEVVRNAYAEVFQFVDPTKDTAERISDTFRQYEPAGQRARMVTLFLGLSEAAGIIAEGKKPAVNAGRAATARPTAKRERKAEDRPPSFGRNLRAADGDLVPDQITGLIQSIPFDGWTKAKRMTFLKTFEAVLDYTVPIISEAEAAADDATDAE